MEASEPTTSSVTPKRPKIGAKSPQDLIFDTFVYVFIGVVTIATLYPF